MSSFNTASLTAAQILLTRRRQAERGPALPEHCRPHDLEAAFAIQCAVSKLNGEPIAGWKCGLPGDGKWVVAPIYANACHEQSPQTAPKNYPLHAYAGQHGQVRIEPELAFIIARNLSARAEPYTPAEVDAAVDGTRLALEIIDTRYEDAAHIPFIDHLADGLFNHGMVLGPEVDSDAALAASHLKITIKTENGKADRYNGVHPTGNPRLPLYWLAEFLRSRGMGLQAGQAVITGSYAGSPDVAIDTDLNIQFGELGNLHVHFKQMK
ncbi:2-keto-4-pentenoate hydratase [Undibacterium sp. TJN19]|uniref:2-keto-4-pentenoate hydratase n=1 Tax=Undibacterium sp. TJN19 TaxID=3413055 RepID=UPI003BF02850